MRKQLIFAVLLLSSSISYAQQDSTSISSQEINTYEKKIEKKNNFSSKTFTVDMTQLQQVCIPGPDGWLHVYGDNKTGASRSNVCADDLHLQCTYNPSKGQYYVTKAVYGCNPNHPNL